jgi:hypothetical protein
LFSGSKTHGKLRLLSALSLLGVAGLASPLAEFSSLGRSPERLAAQEPVKNASQPPISVATEEERNQKIAEDWEQPWLVFYITGNQYGYIEPCGCTGLENQKGGINRKDTLLSSLRGRNWPVMALDGGGQVRKDGVQSEIKFQWTAQAFRQMEYTATTFGVKDLLLSDNILAGKRGSQRVKSR